MTADIDTQDKLSMLLSCYEEYSNLIVNGDSGDEYRGNILLVLNEKFEDVLK